MAKSVIEVLTEARAKVASGWCQGACAVDSRGREIGNRDELACAWCAFGAARVAGDDATRETRLEAENFLFEEAVLAGAKNLVQFNEMEGRTQAEVLDLFDRAIAKAREPKVTTEEVVR